MTNKFVPARLSCKGLRSLHKVLKVSMLADVSLWQSSNIKVLKEMRGRKAVTPADITHNEWCSLYFLLLIFRCTYEGCEGVTVWWADENVPCIIWWVCWHMPRLHRMHCPFLFSTFLWSRLGLGIDYFSTLDYLEMSRQNFAHGAWQSSALVGLI